MKRPAAARLHIVQSCQLSATLLLVPCIVVMVMACAHCPVIITLQWEGVRGWIPSTASNALHRLGLRQGSADAARKNNADAVAAATAVPEGAHLTDWINGNGGKVNVLIRHTPSRGRITVAPMDFKAGDVLAVIPRRLCLPVDERDERMAAAMLWKELRAPNLSFYAPYLATLPSRGEVWSYYNLPLQYLPFIHNTAMEEATEKLQESLEEFHRNRERLMPGHQLTDMSLDDLRYSLSLVKTREFGSQLGTLLVPVIDLANHNNNCKNTITSYRDCGPGAEDGCLVWRAGTDITAGSEVCNVYHHNMTQDRSLLQYGFLQTGLAESRMSAIDCNGYNAHNPWALQASCKLDGGSYPAAGQISSELARLSQLLQALRQGDVKMKASTAAERDFDAQWLSQMLVWRQQRQAAIVSELQQLQLRITALQSPQV